MNNVIRQQIEEVYSTISKITGSYALWAKEHGLSYNALMILYTMEELPNCTQKQICEKWLIPKQTVNTILADFKDKGYVKFEVDCNNKREKIVKFTDSGKLYSYSILAELHLMEETVMLKMGSEMCKQFINTNNAYYELFKKEIEDDCNKKTT